MAHYSKIKTLLKKFGLAKLKRDKKAAVKVLDELNDIDPNIILKAKSDALMAAAIAYHYLRENELHGISGITLRECAEFFNVSESSVSAKSIKVEESLYDLLDDDYHSPALQEIMDDAIENFMDENFDEDILEEDFYDTPHPVAMEYLDLMDTAEGMKVIELQTSLRAIIEKDMDFYDPYLTMAETYEDLGMPLEAMAFTDMAFHRAMSRITSDGMIPESIPWEFIENRHILRTFSNKAIQEWNTGEIEGALAIFDTLMMLNPRDNQGIRYYILAILEKMKSFTAFEKKFRSKTTGWLDADKIEKWFQKRSIKYEEFGG